MDNNNNTNNTNNQKAFSQAQKIYGELMEQYNQGIKDWKKYLQTIKKYNITFITHNYNDYIFYLGKRYYTFYVMSEAIKQKDYYTIQKIEDIAMMVYRLYQGKGHNTYTLIEDIEKENNK